MTMAKKCTMLRCPLTVLKGLFNLPLEERLLRLISSHTHSNPLQYVEEACVPSYMVKYTCFVIIFYVEQII